MEIIEQLYSEVDERAGSEEGFLRIIQLLLTQSQQSTYSSQDDSTYLFLVRGYVALKRRLSHLSDVSHYNNMPAILAELRQEIKEKRRIAKEYAAKIPSDRVKTLNNLAGKNEFNILVVN